MEAEATFNSLVGDLDYPMFVVTACVDAERSGCLVGFATGDHDVFLLAPVLAERGTDSEEFSFHRAKRIEPGHEA